jgi:hypothetical protein
VVLPERWADHLDVVDWGVSEDGRCRSNGGRRARTATGAVLWDGGVETKPQPEPTGWIRTGDQVIEYDAATASAMAASRPIPTR